MIEYLFHKIDDVLGGWGDLVMKGVISLVVNAPTSPNDYIHKDIVIRVKGFCVIVFNQGVYPMEKA